MGEPARPETLAALRQQISKLESGEIAAESGGVREPVESNAVEDAAEAVTPARVEQAKQACLRLLAVRARSRGELTQRLADKGFTPQVSAAALDRLAAVGLVDDAEFARQWVRSRHTHSGKGRKALAHELRKKGVSAEDAATALAEVSADDEYERATELVRRKLRSYPADLPRDTALRRLLGLLARRGYDHTTASAVVQAELAAHYR